MAIFIPDIASYYVMGREDAIAANQRDQAHYEATRDASMKNAEGEMDLYSRFLRQPGIEASSRAWSDAESYWSPHLQNAQRAWYYGGYDANLRAWGQPGLPPVSWPTRTTDWARGGGGGGGSAPTVPGYQGGGAAPATDYSPFTYGSQSGRQRAAPAGGGGGGAAPRSAARPAAQPAAAPAAKPAQPAGQPDLPVVPPAEPEAGASAPNLPADPSPGVLTDVKPFKAPVGGWPTRRAKPVPPREGTSGRLGASDVGRGIRTPEDAQRLGLPQAREDNYRVPNSFPGAERDENQRDWARHGEQLRAAAPANKDNPAFQDYAADVRDFLSNTNPEEFTGLPDHLQPENWGASGLGRAKKYRAQAPPSRPAPGDVLSLPQAEQVPQNPAAPPTVVQVDPGIGPTGIEMPGTGGTVMPPSFTPSGKPKAPPKAPFTGAFQQPAASGLNSDAGAPGYYRHPQSPYSQNPGLVSDVPYDPNDPDQLVGIDHLFHPSAPSPAGGGPPTVPPAETPAPSTAPASAGPAEPVPAQPDTGPATTPSPSPAPPQAVVTPPATLGPRPAFSDLNDDLGGGFYYHPQNPRSQNPGLVSDVPYDPAEPQALGMEHLFLPAPSEPAAEAVPPTVPPAEPPAPAAPARPAQPAEGQASNVSYSGTGQDPRYRGYTREQVMEARGRAWQERQTATTELANARARRAAGDPYAPSEEVVQEMERNASRLDRMVRAADNLLKPVDQPAPQIYRPPVRQAPGLNSRTVTTASYSVPDLPARRQGPPMPGQLGSVQSYLSSARRRFASTLNRTVA